MFMRKKGRRISCIFEKKEGRYRAFIIGAIFIDRDKASSSFRHDRDGGGLQDWDLLFLWWDHDRGGGLQRDWNILFLWRDCDSEALRDWDLLFLRWDHNSDGM
jgi:hypothetical protein